MDSGSFNQYLKQFFESRSGAYSVVTSREFYDSQITVTSFEKTLFLKHHKNIPRGSITSLTKQGISCAFPFRLYPTGETIHLNVNHPKEQGNELRLYLQLALFKPAPGLIWFVFEKDNSLWIGALDELTVKLIASGASVEASQKALIDFSDSEFQAAVQAPKSPEFVEQTIRRVKRNPSVALNAIERAGRTCEMLPKLRTFTSKATGTTYMEAHHLVPIGLQPMFEHSLDVLDNICVLNPFSHRMVHHATFDEIEKHIAKMAERRHGFLDEIGLGVNGVLSIYSGASI